MTKIPSPQAGGCTPAIYAFTTYAEAELRLVDSDVMVATVRPGQHDIALRLAACWNACRGISTSELTNGQRAAPGAAAAAPEDGYRAQHDRDSQELRRLCSERDQARRERDVLKANCAELANAAMTAYGWLWHVNNEPAAPVPLWSPEQAAYEARKALRDLLTSSERGKAINTVQVLLDAKMAAAAQQGAKA